MDKHEIAALLNEISVLLELKGENPFKVRAYINGAHALENLEEDLNVLVKENRLQEIPGIGSHLAEKISSLVLTGHLPYYDEIKKEFPEELFLLFKIQGLGGKKIKVLYEKLGIKNIEDLQAACKKGTVATLPHFGEKTQSKILDGIEKFKQSGQRVLWWNAMEMAQPILNDLSKLPQVKRVEIAGSIRRKLETVGDLDFLVSSSSPKIVMDWFTTQSWVEEIVAKGLTKSSIRLKKGIQADLRVIPEKQYGFALLYFTGSKEHSVKIRQRANHMGYTLSEYSLDSLEGKKSPKNLVTESDIYKALGLSYIPPELREDRGEIIAAENHNLPQLIEETDIKGVLHVHTAESDGHNTLEEMIARAQSHGWEYMGITDHSKSSFQAHGMDVERLFEQIKKIRAINRSKKYSIHVFAGLECDILVNGKMDFPDDILKELDFVVGSVHSSFNLDEKKMTARIIKAVENRYVTILGHVTGRTLLKRDPYAVNLTKVIDACIANNTIIEINGNPRRLDMDWRYWHKAAEKGLKCCINPDAHSIDNLEFFRTGVNVARKGWLEKQHVINTLPLKKIKEALMLKKGLP